jgi:hypothetical protein
VQVLRQPPDIVAADLHIAGHPAAQAGALQAIERIVSHGVSLMIGGAAGK